MSVNVVLFEVQLTAPLKQKLETLACYERRTLENQTVCLIENALRLFEGWGKEDKKRYGHGTKK
jgi:hypothetical protein